MLWFDAPAYTDGRRNSHDFVREVTGLHLERVDLGGKATIRTDAALGEPLEYSVADTEITPLYAVRDEGATALGRFAGTEHVAIASKRLPQHTVWYAALPAWSPEVFSRLFGLTAAHRYSEQGDVVYAGGGFLTVHTKVGGRRVVALRTGQRVEIELPEGPATVVLDSVTGKRVF